ncbi:MAG TPA: phenylalanine--tRNA ligase subunit alpha, partial [Thermosynergistes sp.]|nr:phenylalanine--tRNA ligase subunit alpha [Thermosynergistes sp.]
MADLVEETKRLREEFYFKLNATSSSEDLRDLQISYLGRKGALTGLLKTVGSLPPQERPKAGRAVNALREELEEAIKRRRDEILFLEEEELEERQWLDVTLPGRGRPW